MLKVFFKLKANSVILFSNKFYIFIKNDFEGLKTQQKNQILSFPYSLFASVKICLKIIKSCMKKGLKLCKCMWFKMCINSYKTFRLL